MKVFFDVEKLNSSGLFNVELYNKINESSNFILVLGPNSLDRCVDEKDWVRLEIEHALEKNKNIIPVLMKDFVWPKNMVQSLNIISEYNGVSISREYFSASIEKIVSMMINVAHLKNTTKQHTVSLERRENTYFNSEDSKEVKRLKIQQNLMHEFDKDTYQKVIDSFDNLKVLDIGSNNGDFIMSRLGHNNKVSIVVGLEYDKKSVEKANEKYNEHGGYFYQMNVEDDALSCRLEEIMADKQIEKFNVINLSMIVLHLKNPHKLFKELRKFLSSDGIVVVRDIDDGLNYAHPDKGGDFQRVINICQRNETAGFRHSGRQIYTLLRGTGYDDIKLEKAGLTTIGMDYDERSALFDTYFSFILDDSRIMVERYPNNSEYKADYDWYENIYDELEERFQEETFVFSLGFMIYTARKCKTSKS